MKKLFRKSLILILLASLMCPMCACSYPLNYPLNEAENDAPMTITGGKPWIDSHFKENIPEDMKLSPKDDFHIYVNHDWIKNTQIPDGYTNYSQFAEAGEITKNKAKEVLTDKSLKGHDAELVQALYEKYLDWDTRNEIGMKPLMAVIEDIRNMNSIEALNNLICNINFSRKFVTQFEIGNAINFNDSDSYITAVDFEGFILEDAAEYSERTEQGDRVYNANKKAVAAMYKKLGYSEKEAEDLFDLVIDYEAKIAEVSLTRADIMDPDLFSKINNVMTPEETYGLFKNYPFERYINELGYGNAEKFVVYQPEALKKIDELYNEEYLESIKGQMIINTMLYYINRLDKECLEIGIEKDNSINGASGQLSDDDNAYMIVKNELADCLARAYLEKYDATKTKKEITEIIEEIIVTYRDMIETEDWLSEDTREYAIRKLDKIKINAVYPDKWIDYSKLDINEVSYCDSFDAINDFWHNIDVSRTNGKVDKELWEVNILDANAYYEFSTNSINIILGLLNGDFYNDSMTKEEMYGAIGSIIAHEISHAFDTSGAQYDEDGNLADWWTEEDYKEFTARADKLIKYYDNIIIRGDEHVRGNNIQSEAIADMAAVKCMLAMVEKDADFDYDKFFTKYATNWKRICTPEMDYILLTQDSHPMTFLRTNVTLQQYDKFLDTYDIKEGDNMYLAPEDRITVW